MDPPKVHLTHGEHSPPDKKNVSISAAVRHANMKSVTLAPLNNRMIGAENDNRGIITIDKYQVSCISSDRKRGVEMSLAETMERGYGSILHLVMRRRRLL